MIFITIVLLFFPVFIFVLLIQIEEKQLESQRKKRRELIKINSQLREQIIEHIHMLVENLQKRLNNRKKRVIMKPLTNEETEFCIRVGLYPNSKSGVEPFYGKNGNALWKHPEEQGIIKSTGSYKFELTDKYYITHMLTRKETP